MNHIEVVSILKDLSMSVRMVCARRSDNTLPHRLLDTTQDKAAFAARVSIYLNLFTVDKIQRIVLINLINLFYYYI